MKLQSLLLSLLGALLFLAGVFIGLSLSAGVLWGEVEAGIYGNYNGERSLRLQCPLMLSPAESGVVSAEIINATTKDVKPVVSAEISHGRISRTTKQTLSLAPTQIETVQWVVDSSDVIFERLILVNVLQSQYRDNPSRSGSCGILLYSLFSLTGLQSFRLLFAASLMSMLCGGALWFYGSRPLGNLALNIARASALLAGMTIAALLSSLPRWWGLTLFLDGVILLAFGVMLTEFVLFPQKNKK